MCQQKTATAITPTESTPRHRSPPTLYLCIMHRGMSKEPGVHTCWPHSPFPPNGSCPGRVSLCVCLPNGVVPGRQRPSLHVRKMKLLKLVPSIVISK